MLNFIFRLIFILIVVSILGLIIYTIGTAALENAREGAESMGSAMGPTVAISILFIAVILLAVGGNGSGKN